MAIFSELRGNGMNLVTSWLKKTSSSDCRKAERLEAPLLVAYYWDGDAPMAHEVRNISSTGFYLSTNERWHLGTIITVTLQRTDITHGNSDAEHHVSVLSNVVRLGEDGVGFAFVSQEAYSSGHAVVSDLVGTKTLASFLERLMSDQGHVIIGYKTAIQEKNLLEAEFRLSDSWRERYEETEG
jgi:hypothetical protein